MCFFFFFYFFFQAEDGIRDHCVTGVQTCALPIYFALLQLDLQLQITHETVKTQQDSVKLTNLRVEHGVATRLDVLQAQRSEERRVGKECRSRWSLDY